LRCSFFAKLFYYSRPCPYCPFFGTLRRVLFFNFFLPSFVEKETEKTQKNNKKKTIKSTKQKEKKNQKTKPREF